MAILTPSQLVSASNATYFDNVSGSITPTSVRSLNDDWVSSSILVSQTSSLSVLSASYAGTASVLLGSVVSASYALSSSFALTASYALNAGASIDTGSFVNTSSFNAYTASINGFTGSIQTQVNNLQAATASYITSAQTSSMSVLSASRAVSAANADTASYVASVVSASYATTASKVSILDDNGNNNHKVTFVNTTVPTSGEQILIDPTVTQFTYNPSTNLLVVTASLAQVAQTAQTASYVVSSSYAISSSQAANSTLFNSLSSSQFAQLVANNTFTGNNIFGNITASNASVVSASIQYLFVQYETASVIYSSGSNQFGDAADDVQTLYGTVDIKTGPLLVTGSINVSGGITGSLLGTASIANRAANAITTGSLGQIQIISGSYFNAEGNFYTPTLKIGGGVDMQPITDQSGSVISPGLNLYGDSPFINIGQYPNTSGSIGSGSIGYPNFNISTDVSGTINAYGGAFSGFLSTNVYPSGSAGPLQQIGIALSTYNITTNAVPIAPEACFYGLGTGSNNDDNTVMKTTSYSNNLFVFRNTELSGSLNVLQGITGSLFGTASRAINATSASYALTASFYGGTVVSASYAATASSVNTLIQNVVISGSLSLTGSGITINGDINSTNTVNNIVGRTMIYGGDNITTGATPRLFISGSDGAYTEFGRSLNNISTVKVSSVADASGQIYANTGSVAGQYIGVYDDPGFNTDVEHAIIVSGSGITFNDWDNGSAFDYVPYMTIAPNVGDNPTPQMKRGLGVTGSLNVTQDITLTSATSKLELVGNAAYIKANNITGSWGQTNGLAALQINGLYVSGSSIFSGSVNGSVVSSSISSNTSSLDFSLGNFYTSLVSGSTNFNITNPKPGQTVNLLLSTVGVATASFSSNVKQVSGSTYTPTSGSGKNDILTFISWDGTSVYLANVKNLI